MTNLLTIFFVLVDEIPSNIKNIYKTVWEISQKSIINMAADRGVFIDQSQSMNVFMAEPTYQKLSAMHFHGWKSGLKTGLYYLRTQPAADAIKFTVDKAPPPSCSLDDKDCLSCGS